MPFPGGLDQRSLTTWPRHQTGAGAAVAAGAARATASAVSVDARGLPGRSADMEQLHDLASLMRSHPDYKARETVKDAIRRLMASGRFGVLD